MNLNAIMADVGRRTRRYFSVAEANRSLVLVGRIVGDLVDAYRYLLDLQEFIEAAQEAAATSRLETTRHQVLSTVSRLQGYLKELEELGIELEELSSGIVDFPSLAAGREVRLCWQHGQPAVRYWHEVGATATARRPIETLATRQASNVPAP